MCMLSGFSPTLCNFMDCSLPGSSVHGVVLAKILAFSAHQTKFLKNMETAFEGNRKVALILSQQRGKQQAYASRTVHHLPHEKSRGLYDVRAHSEQSGVSDETQRC